MAAPALFGPPGSAPSPLSVLVAPSAAASAFRDIRASAPLFRSRRCGRADRAARSPIGRAFATRSAGGAAATTEDVRAAARRRRRRAARLPPGGAPAQRSRPQRWRARALGGAGAALLGRPGELVGEPRSERFGAGARGGRLDRRAAGFDARRERLIGGPGGARATPLPGPCSSSTSAPGRTARRR